MSFSDLRVLCFYYIWYYNYVQRYSGRYLKCRWSMTRLTTHLSKQKMGFLSVSQIMSCSGQIKISDKFNINLCVTFLNFQTSSRSNCLLKTITLQELPVSFRNFTEIILHIKFSDGFGVDLCLNLLTFWTRSCSKHSILQLLVNILMHQNLPASCCNFTGSDVLASEFQPNVILTFVLPF